MKPEDIPQDVWVIARGCLCVKETTPGQAPLSVARIARAIMAAKAEERDDIWAIASGNAVGERELERLAKEAGDYEDRWMHALLARENEQLAASIRKRGEG